MIGTWVRTTESTGFYKSGALARLVLQDEDGDWWADFTLFENADARPGVWCVGDWWEVVEED